MPGNNNGKFASSNASTATQYVPGARFENVQRPSPSVSVVLVGAAGHAPVPSVTRTLAIGGSSAARVPSATNPPAVPATQPGGGVVGGGCPSLPLSHTSRHTLPLTIAVVALLDVTGDAAALLAVDDGVASADAGALVMADAALLGVAAAALLVGGVVLLVTGTLGSIGGVVLHAHNTNTIVIQTSCLRITGT